MSQSVLNNLDARIRYLPRDDKKSLEKIIFKGKKALETRIFLII